MDAFDWLAHAIGQLYLAQPLTEVDFRKLKVRHPFMMHVTPLVAYVLLLRLPLQLVRAC